jgi:hypothetical protein
VARFLPVIPYTRARIEVTGPVVSVSEGELQVKTDPSKSPDTTIQVKARGKEAKAKTTDADVATNSVASQAGQC